MGLPLPPPWVVLSFVVAFSRNIQDLKEIGLLGWSMARGNGEEAGCKMCDRVVNLVLRQADLDDMGEDGRVDCGRMCFGIGKCERTCAKINSAMANSTGAYPCMAAGLCPQLDEFGDVECKWSYKTMACLPDSQRCEFVFPNRCQLKPGLKSAILAVP